MYVAGVVLGLGSLGAGGDRCLAVALVGYRWFVSTSGEVYLTLPYLFVQRLFDHTLSLNY